MQFLFDLFPVILFFASFKGSEFFPDASAEFASLVLTNPSPEQIPVFVATIVAILATILQVAWLLVRGKEIKPMLWISLAVIVVFGSLTLWLQNELFIKWKPTILYWIFGAILLYGRATNRNFIQSLLGGQIVMEKRGWHIMQWSWIGFFFVTGIVNLLVAYTCSTDTWVNFKLFDGLNREYKYSAARHTARRVGALEQRPGRISPCWSRSSTTRWRTTARRWPRSRLRSPSPRSTSA